MSHPGSAPVPDRAWKRRFYLVVVVVAIVIVMIAWFRTPVVQVESENAEGGFSTARCSNAGPSRWDPPRVSKGQELQSGLTMVASNQQILSIQIERLHVSAACEQARAAHTNNLIVTTFGASLVLFFGYHALWARRATAAPSREPVAE